MKTKALLLAGLVSLAGIAASQAQTVYSVNAVGFVNLSVPAGFSMIANPLAGADSTVGTLLPSMPNNTKLYKFNPATGTYIINSYRTALGNWTDPTMTLAPGEGAFMQNVTGSPMTITFTGEVNQGAAASANTTIALPAGFSIVSSKIPQAGQLDTVLGFPIAHNDKIYRYDNLSNSYIIYTYRNGNWLGLTPSVAVGESFFAQKVSATSWTRSFSVTN